MLLEMSKSFLNDILRAKGEVVYSKRHNSMIQSGGRRTDEQRNAYWAAAVSHIPKDIMKTRQGRAAMRALGVPYRVIKQAAERRGKLEDSAKGWCAITTAAHRDKVDMQIYRDFWHSELASTEDNVHKELITVYCDTCEEQDGSVTQQYTQHWRRAQLGTDKDCLAAFNASEFAAQLKEATKTAKLPEGRKGNLQDLRLAKCKCIKMRGTAECDCKICSVFEKNLQTYHSKRHGWRNSMRKVGDKLVKPPPCTCYICRNETRKQQFHQFSRSVSAATSVLHPCGKMEYSPYAIGESKFCYFNGMCMSGKCPKRNVFTASAREVSCGWDYVFGTQDCPLEATNDPYTWWAWKPQVHAHTGVKRALASTPHARHTPHARLATRCAALRRFPSSLAAPFTVTLNLTIAASKPRRAPPSRRAHARHEHATCTRYIYMLLSPLHAAAWYISRGKALLLGRAGARAWDQGRRHEGASRECSSLLSSHMEACVTSAWHCVPRGE